jgi:Ferritin-like
VQYLYAAFSVTDEPALTTLSTIAVQEMGHLIGVQNLLLAIGGPAAVHFGRDNARIANPENPVPFALEAVSDASLAKYVTVEMPAEIPAELRAEVDPIVAQALQLQVRPHGVGLIYAKLFWLFQPTDAPVPPLNLTMEPSLGLEAGRHLVEHDFVARATIDEYGADPSQWLRSSVTGFTLQSVTDAASALSLIGAITRQGEGLDQADEELSHFEAFLALKRRLQAGEFTPDPLPVTPFGSTDPPADAVGSTPIADPYTRAWADLYDTRYTLLVVDLWHAMLTSRESTARLSLLGLAYDNMRTSLREVGALLVALGSAPPFGLGIHELPTVERERWELHGRLLDGQEALIAEIQTDAKFADDLDAQFAIDDIRSSDAKRRELINEALGSA